jgi:hypothetical protein
MLGTKNTCSLLSNILVFHQLLLFKEELIFCSIWLYTYCLLVDKLSLSSRVKVVLDSVRILKTPQMEWMTMQKLTL